MTHPAEDELADRLTQRLEASWQVMAEAVDEFHEVTVAAVCEFLTAHLPAVARLELMADIDWRWTPNRYLDAASKEVEVGLEIDDAMSDLFTSALDQLPDGGSRASYGYIDVAQRTFKVGSTVYVTVQG